MNGFKAYKYYMAVKLHFTTDKFDVFKNHNVKGSIEKFKSRNDRFQFDRLAHKMPQDRKLIQFYVANFAYGFPNSIWDQDEALENFTVWNKRRESIAYTFKSDLDRIVLWCESENISIERLFDFYGQQYPELLKLYVGKHVTLETMRILDDFNGFIDRWTNHDAVTLLWDDERRRIKKSRGFIKYDKDKLQGTYDNFMDELRELEVL